MSKKTKLGSRKPDAKEEAGLKRPDDALKDLEPVDDSDEVRGGTQCAQGTHYDKAKITP
jgi:hypothetical protein